MALFGFGKSRKNRDGDNMKAIQLELESLKDEIRNLSERAKDKKREYDGETSKPLRNIIAGELTQILDNLEAQKDREQIIARKLRQASLLERKRKEMEAAKTTGVTQDEIDEVAVEYEDVLAEMKDADRAVAGLEKVSYAPEQHKQRDIDERMAELEAEVAPPVQKPESETVADEDLDQRLKDLDVE